MSLRPPNRPGMGPHRWTWQSILESWFFCGYYLYKMTWSHTTHWRAFQLDKWLTVTFIATVGPYKVQATEGVKLRVFVSLKWPRLTTLYDNVPTVHQLNWHLNLSVALQMPTFFGEQILFNVHSLWVIARVCEGGWFSVEGREGGRENTNEIKRESCQDKQHNSKNRSLTLSQPLKHKL